MELKNLSFEHFSLGFGVWWLRGLGWGACGGGGGCWGLEAYVLEVSGFRGFGFGDVGNTGPLMLRSTQGRGFNTGPGMGDRPTYYVRIVSLNSKLGS